MVDKCRLKKIMELSRERPSPKIAEPKKKKQKKIVLDWSIEAEIINIKFTK